MPELPETPLSFERSGELLEPKEPDEAGFEPEGGEEPGVCGALSVEEPDPAAAPAADPEPAPDELPGPSGVCTGGSGETPDE